MARLSPVSPWRLRQSEADVMDCVCVLGSQVAVAKPLGLSPATVRSQIKDARRKMDARNVVVAAVRWSRWRAGAGA
jgi:DNA-binding CsgD family transcriptional regulator